jgi:hypothetical protein
MSFPCVRLSRACLGKQHRFSTGKVRFKLRAISHLVLA